MKFVKGRRTNLVSVGWQDHVLQVEFRSGQRFQYGGVPKEVCDKLLRVPYPDKLFSQIVRAKYVSERIDPHVLPKHGQRDTPPVAKPQPDFDMQDLPF